MDFVSFAHNDTSKTHDQESADRGYPALRTEGHVLRRVTVIAAYGTGRTRTTNSVVRATLAYRIHTELAERARDALALTAPDSARMHELMAEHLVSDGDIAGAITQYERALAKGPTIPGIHYELGEAILQNSTSTISLARAEREFEAALKENPKNAGATAKLGRIAALRGSIAQAQRQYQRALALDPTQVDALKGMAEIYNQRGETEKAVEYLRRASRAAPFDESIHYQLASLYRELRRGQEASRELAAFEKIRAVKKQTSLSQQRSQSAFQDKAHGSRDHL